MSVNKFTEQALMSVKNNDDINCNDTFHHIGKTLLAIDEKNFIINEKNAVLCYHALNERLRFIDENARKGILSKSDPINEDEKLLTEESLACDIKCYSIYKTLEVVIEHGNPSFGYLIEYYQRPNKMVLKRIKFFYRNYEYEKEIEVNIKDPNNAGIIAQLEKLIITYESIE